MKILIKVLMAPFALLYLIITSLRNHLFNIGYTKSFKFDRIVIGVGNLAVGGSGKTPMVEYIVNLLISNNYKLATLSRGYKRNTSGYQMASQNDTALSLGDEPYQFFKKYGNQIAVAVGEERAYAIPNILFERPETQAIILDDAFQHRYVVPNMNILLTDYAKPFYQDDIMPIGRLRESRNSAKRADVVVVSKCPNDITNEKMFSIKQGISRYTNKPIFFTTIQYETPKPVFNKNDSMLYENVLLFTGIANNKPLIDYVSQHFNLLDILTFADHHNYTHKDVNSILDRFKKLKHNKKTILTTEKDMVKLLNLQQKSELEQLSLYYLPIKIGFIKDGKTFDKIILDLLDSTNSVVNK